MSNQALPRPRFNAPEPERGSKADLKIETRTTPLLQGKVSEIPDVFFGWAMRLCGPHMDVEDVVHEVFLVATALMVIAFVASLFMENVPLRGHEGGREPVASFAD